MLKIHSVTSALAIASASSSGASCIDSASATDMPTRVTKGAIAARRPSSVQIASTSASPKTVSARGTSTGGGMFLPRP